MKTVYMLVTIASVIAAVLAAQPTVTIQHLPWDATATPTYAETQPGPNYTPVVRTATPQATPTLPPTPTGWKMRYNCPTGYPCVTPTGQP